MDIKWHGSFYIKIDNQKYATYVMWHILHLVAEYCTMICHVGVLEEDIKPEERLQAIKSLGVAKFSSYIWVPSWVLHLFLVLIYINMDFYPSNFIRKL